MPQTYRVIIFNIMRNKIPPAPPLDIRVDSSVWAAKLPRLKSLIQKAVVIAIDYQHKLPLKTIAHETQLILTNDQQIKKLNKTHRGKDYTTNVLSFPLYDPAMKIAGGPVFLGDIVLAHDIIAAEAARDKKPFKNHLIHLVVHGVLHLCGYDHETNGQARTMERLEKEILLALNIPDPYHRN